MYICRFYEFMYAFTFIENNIDDFSCNFVLELIRQYVFFFFYERDRLGFGWWPFESRVVAVD